MFDEEKNEDNDFGSDAEWDQGGGYYESPMLDNTKPFVILTTNEVEDRLKAVTQNCTDLFNISIDDATLLLLYYKWNFDKLEMEWFTDQSKIRLNAGIPAERIKRDMGKGCPICFNNFTDRTPESLKCGHCFCLDCWKKRLESVIATGPLSVTSECPSEKCKVKVPPSFFKNCLVALSFNKFQKYLLESFVNNTKKLRWCPGLNCNYIVEVLGSPKIDVNCKCKFIFCFNCGNESHIPATCEMFAKWNDRIKSEGEDNAWIAHNTKACPKCKVLTQKDTGCNHMTCTQCTQEYCWVCLEEWETHIKDYGCNKINKDLFKAEGAKNDTLRFVFYYARYANHLQVINQAPGLKDQLNVFTDVMTQSRDVELADTVFLIDSLNTLVNARKALKNSYVFAYYLKNAQEAQLLEFTQKDLEMNCEFCQELLERDKTPFVNSTDSTNQSFFSYKTELANRTNVVQKFYKSFIKGITEKFAELI